MFTKLLAIGIALLLGFGAVGCSNEEAVDENNNTQQEEVQSNPNLDEAYECVKEVTKVEDEDNWEIIKTNNEIAIFYVVDGKITDQYSEKELYAFMEEQGIDKLPAAMQVMVEQNNINTEGIVFAAGIYHKPDGKQLMPIYIAATNEAYNVDAISNFYN